MKSKAIAAVVSALALALPASAMASGGSGGNGQAQINGQWSETIQTAESQAKAAQNAVNSNAPVNVAGGNITTGSNTATQTPKNDATSGDASNSATTTQSNTQSQDAGSSSCYVGCGGNGQAQLNFQFANTLQNAVSQASAKQNVVNANVPVNIAGGYIIGGSNNATQEASNGATSGNASNTATTEQESEQSQS